MRAKDVMSAAVATVRPDTPAKEAARLLTTHGYTALPVVDEDDVLVGIVTEADLIRGRIPADARSAPAQTESPSVAETSVEQVMTTPVTAMSSGTDVADLCQALVVTGEHDGLPLDRPPFELRAREEEPELVAGPRVGITQAADLPWRYGLAGSPFLSRNFRTSARRPA